MTTLPLLMLQPRSWRLQQRWRWQHIILAVLLVVAVAGGAYLLH